MSNGIISVSLVGLTDVGLVRTNNEDNLLLAEPYTGLLLDDSPQMIRPLQGFNLMLVVSDGMGGYEGGEIASQLTVEAIKSELSRLPKQLSAQCRLEAAIEEANRVVWQQRSANVKLSKMGATATAMFIEQDVAYIAEIGDSRAYILREGRIKQLTTDQTMVQVLIDSGAITPEMAASSLNRNVLLQAIGGQEVLQIAVTAIQIQAQDIFLLCSDGLSGKLQAKEMKEIIQKSDSFSVAAQTLIQAAKDRGGEDNITVILAKFEGSGLKTKVRAETLTKQIQILARFDPEQEVEAKPKREIRPATLEDWISSALIDSFARIEEQRQAFSRLSNFGEYIVFRKGDVLISEGASLSGDDDRYLLLAGKFRLMVDVPARNDRQSVAFLVSPTDHRTDADIQQSEPFVSVKRQFLAGGMQTFSGSLNLLQGRKVTIGCEDDENVVIRISPELFQNVCEVLGDRFISAIRHS